MNLKNLILYSLVLLFFISCKNETKKDIEFNEIYDYDNILTNENKQIYYIDSLLKIYPKSDYFYGIRIMMLANSGFPDSAIDYQNIIAPKEHIQGTFMKMGLAHAFMTYQFKHGWKDSDRLFKESIDADEKKVNIWARIGAYSINFDNKEYSTAEKYILEAHEINNENPYILERLIYFYIAMHNYQKAKGYFEQINSKYFPKRMDKLNKKLDSLLKLPRENINIDSLDK
jgi:hypothetical protein